MSLPRQLADHSAIPTGDVDSLQIVWQNGDSIWSQKIDRTCKATGESLLVNRSQSLAFPGNGLAAAVATKAGLAVAWKDTGGLFLKLGEGWKLRVISRKLDEDPEHLEAGSGSLETFNQNPGRSGRFVKRFFPHQNSILLRVLTLTLPL